MVGCGDGVWELGARGHSEYGYSSESEEAEKGILKNHGVKSLNVE